MLIVNIFLPIVVCVSATLATPLGSSIQYRAGNNNDDQPPRLSDTLAVAKSPFEPITLAQMIDPNARHDSPATVSLLEDDSETRRAEHTKTTRSTQSLVEQERDTTPQVKDESQQVADESSPAAVSTEASVATQADISTTVVPSDSGETTTSGAETEASSLKDEQRQAETNSTTPNPATDITLSASTTTPTPTTSTEANDSSETTTLTNEEAGAVTKVAESTADGAETQPPASEASAATELPTTTTTTTTTVAPASNDELKKVEEQAKPVDKESSVAPGEVLAEPEGASTTVAPVEVPTTEQPTTTTTTEATTTTTTTTTKAPETTEAPTTTTTTTTTAKPAEPKQEEANKAANCNHLPTYNADEVQKVFREETTFRNGTIKGKFTYINFDQRYRLVHYTRLPYGPVKVDLVEELGRPEPAQTNTNTSRSPPTVAASPANEIPNAVLQLRNILPNSLFGFPFVAPNSVSNKPLDPRDGAPSSGSSFYSTEPLSTPNLLSPNVPVSTLSGRRESDSATAPDTLSQNLNDNINLSFVPSQVASPPHQAPKVAQPIAISPWDNSPPVGISSPNNVQFQYALASHANHLEQVKQSQQNTGPVYTYLTNQPSAQYQYSPLPVYAFQQPDYFSANQHRSLPIQTATVAIATPPMTKAASVVSHQPHDHEHYVAPFMLSQTPSADQQNEQPTRLKLRVKSAKSLNYNGLKSAQLRSQDEPTGQLQQQPYQYHRSPVQAYRQSTNNQGRHRAGKQNQELRPTINSTPVVYHVLRSPMGRMYSLPNYRNVHAIAYDLDE